MNCGNLSRSIQDHQPKNYEKTTACYVSKYLPTGKEKRQVGSSQSQLFKHLKNSAMAGSGDFFNRNLDTSTSNKQRYQKFLVK